MEEDRSGGGEGTEGDMMALGFKDRAEEEGGVG